MANFTLTNFNVKEKKYGNLIEINKTKHGTCSSVNMELAPLNLLILAGRDRSISNRQRPHVLWPYPELPSAWKTDYG